MVTPQATTLIHRIIFYLLRYRKLLGKLKIIPLKFGNVWILHSKVSEFEFYFLKFESVWILYPDLLEFRFYSLKFRGIWILHPEVLEF